MIPPWLQAILEAKGAWNGDGIGRAARAGYCRDCGQVVLRGLDADRVALTVTVDPQPLNPLGEFLALATGRLTFSLRWRGRYEIDRRESCHIQTAPARVRGKSSVVVEHRCGDPMPAAGTTVMPEELEPTECPY